MAILNSIKIDKKFRNKGYGAQAFEKTIKYLEILSIDYIALRPFPFEEERDNEFGKKRAIKKFNLNVVNKDSEMQLIMGRNLNYL